MFRTHLKLALRQLMKQRLVTFINIAGLSIAISVAMLILVQVRNELNFDSIHENANRIVRVLRASAEDRSALTPPPLAQTATAELPEVADATHIFLHWDIPLMSVGDNAFYEKRLLYADTHFFDVFSFKLLQGDPGSLAAPFSIMLTESTAERYFGTTDVVGRQITMNTEYTFNITGVLADSPPNSHITFDLVASTESLRRILWSTDLLDRWNFGAMHTYLLLEENASLAGLREKLPLFAEKYMNLTSDEKLELQPLKSVHLHSADVLRSLNLAPSGDMNAIYVLIVIAILLLAIACINYINMQTARSTNRAKEIGLHKVVGADRRTIAWQFFIESYLALALVAAISLGLIEFLRPAFSKLVGAEFIIAYASDKDFWLMLGGVLAVVGLFAGGYPAVRFSALRPIQIFYHSKGLGTSKSWLRRVLVVLQFTASSVLIIGTLVVRQQVELLRSRNLGFDKERIVVVPALDKEIMPQFDRLKRSWEQEKGIERVSAGNSVPGRPMARTEIKWEGFTGTEPERVHLYFIYYDYLETLGMKLAAGRGFSSEFPGDEESSVLINAELARRMGFSNPANAVGRNLRFWDISWPVVGVVSDFNFRSLHDPVSPLVVRLQKPERGDICVRLAAGDPQRALAFMQDTWSGFSQGQPFMYSFLDDELKGQYQSERRWAGIVSYASMLAVFVACLGLFGLATFLAEQRTREIGIRKILGATLTNIVMTLSREFAQLVLVGVILAVPLTLWAANQWLQSFAYRVDLGVWPFILAGGISLLLALATTSIQAMKAGRLNPVDAIKYE